MSDKNQEIQQQNEEQMNPTVSAVVQALNNPNRFQPSYIKQNVALKESSTVELVAQNQTQVSSDDNIEEDQSVDVNEEFEEDTNAIYIDIYEENGRIVAIDNAVIFEDYDNVPELNHLEKYLGPNYINEKVDQQLDELFGLFSSKDKTTGQTKPGLLSKIGSGVKSVFTPKKKASINDLQPVTVTGKKKPVPATSSDLQPVTITSKKRDVPDTLDGVKISSQKKAGAKAITYQDIAKANKIADPNKIKAGQKIKLPDGSSYTIQKGDTLSGIAKNAGRLMNQANVRKPSIDDLEPVQITSRKKQTIDDLQPVKITSRKKPEVDYSGYTGAGNAGTIGDDEGFQSDSGYDPGQEPTYGDDGMPEVGISTQRQRPKPSSGGVPIRFGIRGQSGVRKVGRSEFKAARQSGDIGTPDVIFNMRSADGTLRRVRAGDEGYAKLYAQYKQRAERVDEALLRAGAVLNEDGWYLNGELIETVELVNEATVQSPYYYDSTGRLRIISESEIASLSLADAILERTIKEALDKVGEEDEDIDNDGDSDKSDEYLAKRRKAISKAMNEGSIVRYVKQKIAGTTVGGQE